MDSQFPRKQIGILNKYRVSSTGLCRGANAELARLVVVGRVAALRATLAPVAAATAVPPVALGRTFLAAVAVFALARRALAELRVARG